MKKFISAFMLMAVMAFSVSTFVSCNDLADEVEAVNDKANANEKDIQELKDALALVDGKIADAKDAAEAAALIAAKKEIENALKGYYTKSDVDALINALKTGEIKTNADAIATLKLWKGALAEYLGLVEKDGKVNSPVIDKALADIEKILGDLYAANGTCEIDNIRTEMTELETRINTQISEKLTAVNKLIWEILKSMVFVPQVYVDGVESAKYTYATGNVQASTPLAAETAVEVEGVDNTWFLKDAKTTWANASTGVTTYAAPRIDTMYFHMNPADADLTGASWAFLNATPETKADAEAKAVWVKSEKEEGLLKVAYKITDADKLYKDTKLNVAALQATFTEGEGADAVTKAVVTSDYLAFDPSTITFKALAYVDAATETKVPCPTATLGDHLYKNATNALIHPATVKWHYNGGPKNLAELINIHYVENPVGSTEVHKTMTLDDAVNNYGLTVEFANFDYLTGSNKTHEGAYLSVNTETGVVTPRYVNDANESVEIAKDSETGVSAVGRKPMVLVTVKSGNNVVLVGYIKLEITREDPTPVVKELVIDKSAGKLPYICGDTTVVVTWDDMSGKVLEALKLTKNEFTTKYDIKKDSTYVKVNGKFVHVEKVAANAGASVYGTIEETENADNTQNNALKYTLDKDAVDEVLDVENPFTLYVKYVTANNDVVYVGIKIQIADKPVVTAWGTPVAAYWKDAAETNALASGTVRFNVPEPSSATGADVKNYIKDLDEYFYHDADGDPATNLTAEGIELELNYDEAAYAKVTIDSTYKYVFSTKNAEVIIDDPDTTPAVEKLAVSTDQKTLYWGAATAGNEIAVINTVTGYITYRNNAVAKKFLNLYSHNAAERQYALVEIVASYCTGDATCTTEIPMVFNGVNNMFSVRFLRPLDILPNQAAELTDATANGASVILGKFFTAKDWRDKDVLAYDSTTGVVSAPKDNEVDLFDYYEISEVKVDIAGATTNLNTLGTADADFQPVSGTPIVLGLKSDVDAKTNADLVTVTGNVVTLDAATDLNKVKLTYSNNNANVQQFIIKVPVEVTYAWGVQKLVVPVTVKHTIANN